MEQVQAVINSAMGQTTIIAIVLETLFRLIKTEKPLSLLYVIAKGGHQLAKLLESAAVLMDKVLPQRLK